MFSAETAGIALGLAMALGIFSFKTAVGEYSFCSRKIPTLKKLRFLLLTWAAYALLFAAAFLLLERIDPFRLAGDSAGFLRIGVVLHLVLCTGLMVWGIRLLCREKSELTDPSGGWLLLTIPCPVCAASVFLVCAFARMLFPGALPLLFWTVPLFFLLSNLLFLLFLSGTAKLMKIPPLVLTGRMMILIALYFFLILLIAPQFESAGRLYAVARSSGAGGPGLRVFIVLLPAAVASAAGFLLNIHPRKGV